MTANNDADATIRQLEFELEKAEHGLALPYDAEHVAAHGLREEIG